MALVYVVSPIDIIPDIIPDKTINRIDAAKAFKLRVEKNLSFQNIGDILGVSKQAVWERLQPIIKFIDNPEITTLFKENKATLAEAVQFKYLAALLDDDKLEKASANNIAYTIKELNQIIQLSRGDSTSNVALLHGDIAALKGHKLKP